MASMVLLGAASAAAAVTGTTVNALARPPCFLAARPHTVVSGGRLCLQLQTAAPRMSPAHNRAAGDTVKEVADKAAELKDGATEAAEGAVASADEAKDKAVEGAVSTGESVAEKSEEGASKAAEAVEDLGGKAKDALDATKEAAQGVADKVAGAA